MTLYIIAINKKDAVGAAQEEFGWSNLDSARKELKNIQKEANNKLKIYEVTINAKEVE